MRFLKNRKYLVLLLITVCAGSYYFFFIRNQETQQTVSNTFAVSTGDIVSSIDTFGKSNLLYEQKLKFSQVGKVKKVFVKPGDEVTQGYVIAELDNEEANNDIKQSQVKLENVQTGLTKLLYDKENFEYIKLRNDKLSQETKLESLKQEVEILKQEQSLQKKEKEISYLDATKKLEASKTGLPNQKQELEKEIELTGKDILTKEKSLLEKEKDLPDFIGREERSKGTKLTGYDLNLKTKYLSLKSSILTLTQDFDTINNTLVAEKKDSDPGKIRSQYFSGYKSQYASDAEKYYFEAKTYFLEFKKLIEQTDTESLTIENLQNLVQKESRLYNPLSKTAEIMYLGFDNSIENLNFDNATISGGKSTMNSLKVASESKYNQSLEYLNKIFDQDSKKDIQDKSDDIIQARKDEIENLKLEIERLKKTLSTLTINLGSKKLDLDIAINKDSTGVESLNIGLKKIDIEQKTQINAKNTEIDTLALELKKTLRKIEQIGEDEEITLAENNLKEAQISLDQKIKKLEAYQIIAPFGGKVNRVEFKVGDTVDTNSTSYIYIVNPNLIQITIQLDQVDIVKVQKGQEATISFDAYPGKVFTGSLGDVDGKPADNPGGDTSIVNYPVNILFEKQGDNIYSGMSANISIILSKKNDIITLPQTSLETDKETGEKYVSIDKSGVKTKQIVQTGLTGNGSVEIISGLSIGESVYEVNFDANQFTPDQYYGGGIGGF